jgi:hypothetical protein
MSSHHPSLPTFVLLSSFQACFYHPLILDEMVLSLKSYAKTKNYQGHSLGPKDVLGTFEGHTQEKGMLGMLVSST